jgi:hypothetical protein
LYLTFILAQGQKKNQSSNTGHLTEVIIQKKKKCRYFKITVQDTEISNINITKQKIITSAFFFFFFFFKIKGKLSNPSRWFCQRSNKYFCHTYCFWDRTKNSKFFPHLFQTCKLSHESYRMTEKRIFQTVSRLHLN